VDPPVLTCAPRAVLTFSAWGEVVHLARFVGMEDRDPHVVLTFDPPSGSVFPLGVTPVTCMATDGSGNVAECTFPVTVVRKARRR